MSPDDEKKVTEIVKKTCSDGCFLFLMLAIAFIIFLVQTNTTANNMKDLQDRINKLESKK